MKTDCKAEHAGQKNENIIRDTSVLIAAIIKTHPEHKRSFPWLKKAKAKEFEMCIASHTLAELYAVLTTLPLKPKISPETAHKLIHENIETIAKIVSLNYSDYKATINQMVEHNLAGGVIYDALIVTAAQKTGADKTLTLNIDDFKRVCADNADHIMSP